MFVIAVRLSLFGKAVASPTVTDFYRPEVRARTCPTLREVEDKATKGATAMTTRATDQRLYVEALGVRTIDLSHSEPFW